ncbi:MAG: hypothetical protein C0506_16455, partial [Anaerolinea sp.]|nr:hypothetical protein [Anaerolinea sp.]
ERLGEGGMGTVFKARHRKLGRVVAVKRIRKERLGNSAAVRRFHREIRAAAQLDHPNIVRALDADDVGGTHLLIMEYAPGADLARLVGKHGPLPVEKACDYCRQAALGLQHAHDRGMVHRDVKPHNLLLMPGGVVKVLDMGLAWIDPGETGVSSSTLTGDGTVVGTLDYLAPEQAMNSHAVDGRADLYSLGCTLYFLLTGHAPFSSGTALEKLLKHRLEEPEAIERLRPNVPPAVVSVVRTLMAKRPEDRYPSAAAAAVALAAATRKLKPEAQPAPADVVTEAAADGFLRDDSPSRGDTVAMQTSRPRRSWRSLPWLVAGTASGAALLALGILGMFLLLSRSQDPPPAPVSRPAVKPEEFDRWVKRVAALPPEEQVKAVEAELKRRNSGFNGTVKGTIGRDVTERDVVIGLEFPADQVTDLSPLRVLTGLTNLNCKGTGEQVGLLADLSPLAELPLTSLDCSNSAVSDLSPLKKMKLSRLNCSRTKVAELKPLAELRLTFLECSETHITDLSPLEGMPLVYLSCALCSQVTNLLPLKGMPLDHLDCSNTGVSNLSPLAGM